MSDEDEGGWYVAWTECRVCPDGARHISVFPSSCDPDALECPRCHHMTAEAVEYIPRQWKIEKKDFHAAAAYGMPRHDGSGRISESR